MIRLPEKVLIVKKNKKEPWSWAVIVLSKLSFLEKHCKRNLNSVSSSSEVRELSIGQGLTLLPMENY